MATPNDFDTGETPDFASLSVFEALGLSGGVIGDGASGETPRTATQESGERPMFSQMGLVVSHFTSDYELFWAHGMLNSTATGMLNAILQSPVVEAGPPVRSTRRVARGASLSLPSLRRRVGHGPEFRPEVRAPNAHGRSRVITRVESDVENDGWLRSRDFNSEAHSKYGNRGGRGRRREREGQRSTGQPLAQRHRDKKLEQKSRDFDLRRIDAGELFPAEREDSEASAPSEDIVVEAKAETVTPTAPFEVTEAVIPSVLVNTYNFFGLGQMLSYWACLEESAVLLAKMREFNVFRFHHLRDLNTLLVFSEFRELLAASTVFVQYDSHFSRWYFHQGPHLSKFFRVCPIGQDIRGHWITPHLQFGQQNLVVSRLREFGLMMGKGEAAYWIPPAPTPPFKTIPSDFSFSPISFRQHIASAGRKTSLRWQHRYLGFLVWERTHKGPAKWGQKGFDLSGSEGLYSFDPPPIRIPFIRDRSMGWDAWDESGEIFDPGWMDPTDWMFTGPVPGVLKKAVYVNDLPADFDQARSQLRQLRVGDPGSPNFPLLAGAWEWLVGASGSIKEHVYEFGHVDPEVVLEEEEEKRKDMRPVNFQNGKISHKENVKFAPVNRVDVLAPRRAFDSFREEGLGVIESLRKLGRAPKLVRGGVKVVDSSVLKVETNLLRDLLTHRVAPQSVLRNPKELSSRMERYTNSATHLDSQHQGWLMQDTVLYASLVAAERQNRTLVKSNALRGNFLEGPPASS